MPRGNNPLKAKRSPIALNQTVREYLDAIALTGIYGNVWTDVAKKFISDGVAQALRDGVVPRRKLTVSYETDDTGKS